MKLKVEDDSRLSTAFIDGKSLSFKSGLGDGVYASYFGYDVSGEIVCLVTDFGLKDNDV